MSADPEINEHLITTRESPIEVLLFCTCGWTDSVTRRQNALARAAKVKGKIRRHYQSHEVKLAKRKPSIPGEPK